MWGDEETAAALRIGHEMTTRNGADEDAFQFDGVSRHEHCQTGIRPLFHAAAAAPGEARDAADSATFTGIIAKDSG